jgi:hypothetical protein
MAACGVLKCTPGTGGGAGWVVVRGVGEIEAGADGTIAGVVAAGVVGADGVVAGAATLVEGDAVGMVALRSQPVAASTRASPAAALSGRRRAVRRRVDFIGSSPLDGQPRLLDEVAGGDARAPRRVAA